MEKHDSLLIDRLRGASILRVVLGHLGLTWIFLPYSSYLSLLLTILFFCSGYISYFLFLKERNPKKYLVKRLLSLLMPFYLIYFVALVLYILITKDTQSLTAGHLSRVLHIAPHAEETPYPMGQIWFLRVLLFCTVTSVLVFSACRFSRHLLLIPVFIALALSTLQLVRPIAGVFILYGHDFYQEIVYGAFFYVGAYIYTFDWRSRKGSLGAAGIVLSALAALAFQWTTKETDLAYHVYSPSLYFMSLGTGTVLLVLSLSGLFEYVCERIKLLAYLFDFSGRHSYGIYLLHSFFIVFVEVQFGWVDVISNPKTALFKVAFVVTASLVCAPPFTYVAKAINNRIKLIL